ncbi:hypothetical protein [Gordonia crocea]|uniref:Uncharacterized protein n=1 Tax=Gordonia crocea TaxID=589162 RepID=A0A7I9UXH0_9ACTN|nr:hypothetical protein [Gordonia crocea]GED97632.1 hypothetical protein nbrc107697_16710 [Gordonia crocea]
MVPHAHPGQPYPPQPYPGQPYPPQYAGVPPKPPLKNAGLVRALGAVPIVGWFAIIVFGFATFTNVTAKSTGGVSTFNGFGHWTEQGEGLPLHHGAHAMTLGGVYPTLALLLPALIVALLIVFAVAPRAMAIINIVVSVLATLMALLFIVRPDFTTITFDSRSSDYVDSHYSFSAGPSAYLTLVVCLLILGASIATAVLGGRAKPASAPLG